MSDLKDWYKSKTIWGAALAVIAPMLHLTGIDIGIADQAQIADSAVTIVGAIGGLVAVYGRLAAKSMIK